MSGETQRATLDTTAEACKDGHILHVIAHESAAREGENLALRVVFEDVTDTVWNGYHRP